MRRDDVRIGDLVAMAVAAAIIAWLFVAAV